MSVTMIRGHRLTEPRTPITLPARPEWMFHPDRPCVDNDLWTSDNPNEVGVAAQLCRTHDCPVMRECGRWAIENGVCWGAWGGLNFATAETRNAAHEAAGRERKDGLSLDDGLRALRRLTDAA